jgi:hypothetical protein
VWCGCSGPDEVRSARPSAPPNERAHVRMRGYERLRARGFGIAERRARLRLKSGIVILPTTSADTAIRTRHTKAQVPAGGRLQGTPGELELRLSVGLVPPLGTPFCAFLLGFTFLLGLRFTRPVSISIKVKTKEVTCL